MQQKGCIPSHRSCCLLPLLLVLVVQGPTASHAAANRRLLIRPYPLGKATCRNTIAGPLYYADDKGSVCDAAEFDYKTGCCSGGKKHSCDKCSPTDRCCDSYEHCVSCCQAPGSHPEALQQQVHTIRSDPKSPLWSDAFEFCRFYCRSHGRSTSHENSYIGARHHCFSRLGKPMLDPPLPAGALEGVTLVMGQPGGSCDAACAAASSTCSQEHFPLLDSCDRLRELVSCEAGCVAEAPEFTMPYYVDPDAPKPSRPALCLVRDKKAAAAADNKKAGCGDSDTHQRRLCPCKKGSTPN